MSGGWRTVSILVELPVAGPVTNKEVKFALENAAKYGAFEHSLTKYNSNRRDMGAPEVRIGKPRFKDFARVKPAIEKKRAF